MKYKVREKFKPEVNNLVLEIKMRIENRPNITKKIESNSKSIEEVRKLLSMRVNNSNTPTIELYELILEELNEEIVDNAKILKNIFESHFDTKEMKDYLKLIKLILEEKKKDKISP